MTNQESGLSQGVEPEFQIGETLIIKREDFLAGKYGFLEDLTEIAMANFLNEFAGDNNILGFALSSMRVSGGIYTHVFVRNLPDRDAMRATLETTGRSFQHLESAARQDAGPHSYINMSDKSPQEFAEWFKEEFHSPHNYGEEDLLRHFTELAGSSEELELLGIVMFE